MRCLTTSLLCAFSLLAVACGDGDAPDHGLKVKALESTPRGEAVHVTFDLKDGMAWTAELSMRTEVFQRGVEGGRKKDQRLNVQATLEHTWRIVQPMAEAPMTSRIGMRYVSAEGTAAEILLKRPPLTGRMAHESRGRPATASLRLEGSTKHEQEEARDLIGSLLLAGYGGAPSWIPARPIRQGESWPLAPIMQLRAVSNIRRRAYDLGVSAPEPLFKGTVRLLEIRTEGADTLLELQLDAIIEIDGTFRKEGRVGTMSAGNHFRGTATVDARTGVARRFDVTHTNKMHVRSAGDDITIGGSTTVRGTVRRDGKNSPKAK